MSTNQSNQKRREQAIQRMRSRKLRNTILISLLFLLIAAVGIGGIYLLKGGSLRNLPKPYDVVAAFPGEITDSQKQKAEGIAADLCVVEENVELSGVTLEEGQKGALFDLDEHKVLYAKDVYEKVYPASITKLVTAILALKSGNLEDTVTITQEDLNLEAGSQVCGFLPGDKVTMDQLLHCLLVYSGNDAAAAIARTVGGSISQFVDMMNQEAARLGATGTHFTNPHGLQDENHYTTVYDIYLILQEALNYQEFVDIAQMSAYTANVTAEDGTVRPINLEATDHYLTGEATLPKDVTVLGGKTGTTKLAGNCLALLTQNAYGKPFISIVMGASSKDLLYQQMSSLLAQMNQGQ